MAEMSQAAEASSQANMNNGRPVYEAGFHVVPTVGDDGVAAVVDRVRAILKGAEIVSEQFPQKMRLAYTVERADSGKRTKFDEAYFGFIKFASQREDIPAIEQELRADKDILRHLLIETVREDIGSVQRRAVFSSDRLEGETIHKPQSQEEKKGEVSQEQLDKSIDALVS